MCLQINWVDFFRHLFLNTPPQDVPFLSSADRNENDHQCFSSRSFWTTIVTIFRVRHLCEGVRCEWTTRWEKVNLYTICNQLLSHTRCNSLCFPAELLVGRLFYWRWFCCRKIGKQTSEKKMFVIGYTEKVKWIVALMNFHDLKRGYFHPAVWFLFAFGSTQGNVWDESNWFNFEFHKQKETIWLTKCWVVKGLVSYTA